MEKRIMQTKSTEVRHGTKVNHGSRQTETGKSAPPPPPPPRKTK